MPRTAEVVIIVFQLPSGSPRPVVNRFVQKFYGQETTKNGGRSHYRKVGLLDGIPHRKLRSGVVIVAARDEKAVREFLEAWKVPLEVRVIRPTPSDMEALHQGVGAPSQSTAGQARD
ncbi:MAG: hypothetical protein ACYCPN_05755 [Thermoplasmata archaeon]